MGEIINILNKKNPAVSPSCAWETLRGLNNIKYRSKSNEY
jgi:hypothetical protein